MKYDVRWTEDWTEDWTTFPPAVEQRITNLCDPLVVFTDISLLMAGALDTGPTSLPDN